MTGQSMRKALTEDRIRAMREDPGPDVSEHALDHTVSLEETPDGVRAFMLFDRTLPEQVHERHPPREIGRVEN